MKKYLPSTECIVSALSMKGKIHSSTSILVCKE